MAYKILGNRRVGWSMYGRKPYSTIYQGKKYMWEIRQEGLRWGLYYKNFSGKGWKKYTTALDRMVLMRMIE